MWLLCCKVSTGWAGGPRRCMEAGAPWPSCCITPPSSAASPGAPHQPFSSSPGSVVTADCYNNRREMWYTTYFFVITFCQKHISSCDISIWHCYLRQVNYAIDSVYLSNHYFRQGDYAIWYVYYSFLLWIGFLRNYSTELHVGRPYTFGPKLFRNVPDPNLDSGVGFLAEIRRLGLLFSLYSKYNV